MQAKSPVAPKLMRSRKMDAAVKAKVEKLVDMGGQPCKYGSPYHEDDH